MTFRFAEHSLFPSLQQGVHPLPEQPPGAKHFHGNTQARTADNGGDFIQSKVFHIP